MADSTAAQRRAEEWDKRALDSMSEQPPGEKIEPVGPALDPRMIESLTGVSAIAAARALAKAAAKNAAASAFHAPSPESVATAPKPARSPKPASTPESPPVAPAPEVEIVKPTVRVVEAVGLHVRPEIPEAMTVTSAMPAQALDPRMIESLTGASAGAAAQALAKATTKNADASAFHAPSPESVATAPKPARSPKPASIPESPPVAPAPEVEIVKPTVRVVEAVGLHVRPEIPEAMTVTSAIPAVESSPEPRFSTPPATHTEPAATSQPAADAPVEAGASTPGMPQREELMLIQAEIRDDLLRNFLGRHDGKPLICVAFALISCAAYALEQRYSRAFAASALAKMARGVERGTLDYDNAETHRTAQTARETNGKPEATS